MDLQQLYNQARQAQKNGNLAEAARLYSQILSASSVPEVMVNYGNVLAQLGRHTEALAQYNQALKQKKNFFEALFNRGNLFLETGRTPEALADFESVVAIRPDVPAVWNNRGTALRRLRR
jgi:tetratricopeptide (TPR) repeat protein